MADWIEGLVQIRASQSRVGPIEAMAMSWRMAGGATVWIRPIRL